MYSNLLQSIAVERVRDMRSAATAASLARSARPARRAGAVRSGATGWFVRRTVHS